MYAIASNLKEKVANIISEYVLKNVYDRKNIGAIDNRIHQFIKLSKLISDRNFALFCEEMLFFTTNVCCHRHLSSDFTTYEVHQFGPPT